MPRLMYGNTKMLTLKNRISVIRIVDKVSDMAAI